MGHLFHGEPATAVGNDPAADPLIAESSHQPAAVRDPTAAEHMKHHEVDVVGELQVSQLVTREQGAQELRQLAPTGRRRRSGNLRSPAR
jgi:hypothetical protein